ncbi:MAG: hypothetical protein Q8876_02585 [Bacillota bacterium]|nr:hypothetical protein [Bacillota bacterium]
MDKFGTSPDNELSMNIAKTALYGREQTITNEQLNGQIAYLLQNRTKKDDSDFHLISCAVNFYKSKKSMMYIQALYKGAKLSINSNIDIVLDEKAEKLRIQLSKCSVGLLPIPAKMITDGIKESDDYKQKLHEYINVTDNEIILPSSYAVDDKKSDVKINIKMTKITENDGSVTIQVNSLLNNLEDIFSKFFKK